MTTADEERPFVSPGPDQRGPAGEHHDAVQLLVINTLRKFTSTLVEELKQAAKTHERLASEEVMERAYYTTLSGRMELMGMSEAAACLEVSKAHMYSLAKTHKKLPKPVARLECGPIWLGEDIRRFKATWERKVGRPKKEKET